MRRLAFILILAFLGNAYGQSEHAEIIPNGELQNLLANLVLLAEFSSPDDSPFSVQVFKEEEHGECGDDANLCPKSWIYIVMSNFEDKAKRLVCKLPEGYQWRFRDWLRLPEGNGMDNFVALTLDVYYPSDEPNEGRWVTGRMVAEVSTEGCAAYYV